MADETHSVFISHIHEDDEGLAKLKELLAKRGLTINDSSINAENPNNAKSKEDNIYHKNSRGRWDQQDSHHSYAGGVPNPHNIKNDTQTDIILLSKDYAYWGGSGPKIPRRFRNWNGVDICAGRNHKSRFPADLVEEFIAWFRSLDASGFQGTPIEGPGMP